MLDRRQSWRRGAMLSPGRAGACDCGRLSSPGTLRPRFVRGASRVSSDDSRRKPFGLPRSIGVQASDAAELFEARCQLEQRRRFRRRLRCACAKRARCHSRRLGSRGFAGYPLWQRILLFPFRRGRTPSVYCRRTVQTLRIGDKLVCLGKARRLYAELVVDVVRHCAKLAGTAPEESIFLPKPGERIIFPFLNSGLYLGRPKQCLRHGVRFPTS